MKNVANENEKDQTNPLDMVLRTTHIVDENPLYTVEHEFGHYLGLDHPGVSDTKALMSGKTKGTELRDEYGKLFAEWAHYLYKLNDIPVSRIEPIVAEDKNKRPWLTEKRKKEGKWKFANKD